MSGSVTSSRRPMLPLLEQQAKERQTATLKRGTETPVREKVPERETGKASEHAAAAVKVNPRYVSDAKRIAEKAPEPMDAGQARGEIASRETFHGNQWSVTEQDTPPATLSDLGITRQRLHKASPTISRAFPAGFGPFSRAWERRARAAREIFPEQANNGKASEHAAAAHASALGAAGARAAGDTDRPYGKNSGR